MSDIAIVIALSQGGLYAVVDGSGYAIIPNTVRQFSSLTTSTDGAIKVIGELQTGQSGWIALAEYENH